jgi:hypothetical protein
MKKRRLAVADIHSRIGRFRFLTIVLLCMIALRPFLEELVFLGFLTDLIFVFLFFSGVYAVRDDQSSYHAAWVLTAGFVAFRLSRLYGWADWAEPFENLLVALFLAFTLYSIYRQMQREQQVTLDLIFAACCSYLLIGLVWAHAYYFVELAYPGSFKGIEPGEEEVMEFGYYSFITLTTAGFGDIVPVSQQARSLSVLEAVTGQLYLAILVGRLVGAYVSEPQGGGK